MPLEVLIVGGGKVGAHLADLLREGGHRIGVIESDPDHVRSLEERLGIGVVMHGTGTDARVLESAGIRNVDVVAAVTGADETNLVVSALARFEFAVPRVIARVVDPRNAWMFGPDMGVDAALNQGDLLAHLVAEEMSLGEMTTLLKLRRGQFSLVEEKVPGSSRAAGKNVADLGIPDGCAIVAVIRDGELLAGHGQLRIEAGDEVLAVVPTAEAAALSALLGA
jgi:trk system potassium uptake protein TrkA